MLWDGCSFRDLPPIHSGIAKWYFLTWWSQTLALAALWHSSTGLAHYRPSYVLPLIVMVNLGLAGQTNEVGAFQLAETCRIYCLSNASDSWMTLLWRRPEQHGRNVSKIFVSTLVLEKQYILQVRLSSHKYGGHLWGIDMLLSNMPKHYTRLCTLKSTYANTYPQMNVEGRQPHRVLADFYWF